MFTRRRPIGLWTFDSVVTSAEFEYFDDSISKAIDGSGGGAYALSADLQIGGATGVLVRINTDTTHIDSKLITLGTSTTNELYVNGQTIFYGKVFCNQDVTVGVDATSFFTVNAVSQIYGVAVFFNKVNLFQPVEFEDTAPATFKGTSHFIGAVTVGDTAANTCTVHATTTFTSSMSCTGTTTLGGNGTVLQAPLTMGSGGSIVQNVAAGDDSITHYSPIDFHEVVMEADVLSGSTDWFIDDAGCQDGNEILFTNKDTTHSITVRKPGGAPVRQPNGNQLDLLGSWCRCVRIGGQWTLTQYGTFPPP